MAKSKSKEDILGEELPFKKKGRRERESTTKERERVEDMDALLAEKAKLSSFMQGVVDKAILKYRQNEVKSRMVPVRKPLKAIEVRKLRKDLDLLRAQAIYLTDVGFSFGKNSDRITFNPENLGVGEKLEAAMNRAGFKITVRVNFKFKEAKTRLYGLRDAAKRECLLPFAGFDVLPAERLMTWEMRKAEMYVALEEEKIKALRWHDNCLMDYAVRIAGYIQEAGYIGEEAQSIMNYYIAKFPTRSEIEERMQVEELPLWKIPSIKEAVKEDAELSRYEAIVALERAKRTRAEGKERLAKEAIERQERLAREMEIAERRAAMQTEQMLRDRVRQVADDVAFHYLTLVQRSLRQLQEADYKPNPEQQRGFNRALERLEDFLLSENKNMEDIFQRMTLLGQMFDQTVTSQDVEERRQQIKQQIESLFADHVETFISFKVQAKGRDALALENLDLDDDYEEEESDDWDL
jgi:hypothetical protein